MLILTEHEVRDLLDLDELVDALASAMADLSAGDASVPPRVAAIVERRGGILGAMPGYLPSSNTLAAKLVSVFPRNAERGLHTHNAVIVVFDAETGTPAALMDGTYITAVRTAAGSALATRLLTREDASSLAILGTGVQARTHARALCRVRPITEVRVAGRDARKAEALAEELRRDFAPWFTGRIAAAPSFEAAIHGADIVSATTHSPEPVTRREWLSPGTHVNSVGVNQQGPEIDAATVADAVVVVESRASALAPFPAGAADLLHPIRDGVITGDHVHAEVGELVLGTKPGRTSEFQITLYKSVGVAVQDAAAAALVLRAAQQRGVGVDIEL